jgi:chromosome segregation ATPase
VRAQEQLTVNERLAKAMMRKRALHYVEKRDDFELKVARITRRLQKLVQEGEQWKHRFETFEKYAERLSREAEDLKGKIDKEQREARRLSNLNSEREQQNADLQDKLAQTEGARAEAMRQLSDMHHS